MKLAVNNIKNWIFVTGIPRSGSTFVGNVLSFPRQVDYIHEPFNPQCGLPGVSRWHRYMRATPNTPEMKSLSGLIKPIFDYDFKLRTYFPDNEATHQKLLKSVVGSRGPFYLRMARLNLFHQAAIIKDPIGNLMAEYLYAAHDVKPLIVIKHPISYIASLRRVNWHPKLAVLNDQKALIEDYFADEPDFLYKKWETPLEEAAAFWRVIYKVLSKQISNHPGWCSVTHESLSESPVPTFKSLYDRFELPWSEKIEQKILTLTNARKGGEAKGNKVQDFRRNSSDIFKLRRNSLSVEERQKVFDITQDIALRFYAEDTFDI